MLKYNTLRNANRRGRYVIFTVLPSLCRGVTMGFVLTASFGCSQATSFSKPAQPAVQLIAKPAPAPEGVVRYCWEEPMAIKEDNGPGLDAEGHWYSPKHTAVREVRMGRWRPCEVQVSETSQGVVR